MAKTKSAKGKAAAAKETKKPKKVEAAPEETPVAGDADEGATDAPEETAAEESAETKKEETIGDIVEEEGLVTEPDRESMLGKEGSPELSEITMKLDKIEGKNELFKGMLDSFNERVLDLNERLGDTRRMVFEREKVASKMEGELEQVLDIVKELDPEKIVLKFEKFKLDIDKESSHIERLNDLLHNLTERTKVIEDKTSKITSLENVVNAGKMVEEKIKEIEDTKKYADKMASKVEAMFLEINEKISFIKSSLDLIEKHDTMLQEFMKDVDQIRFQIDEELVKRKQVDEMAESIKDVIVEEMVGINPAAFDNVRRRVAIMEYSQKNRKQLDEERKNYMSLMEKVERDFQMGRIKRISYDELKKSTEKKLEEIEMVLETRLGKKGKKEKPRKLKEKLVVAPPKSESPKRDLEKQEDKEKEGPALEKPSKVGKLKEKLMKLSGK